MKAICVTANKGLAVRDIPTPEKPAPGHILVDMDASAINLGDKIFLTMPAAAGNVLAPCRDDVWGASGSGRVVAVAADVPAEYMGKQVAIYRSLNRGPESIGLWCERAQVSYMSCLILPDHVRTRDYCGSLVNVITAYAFLEEIVDAGHKGVIVTAGNSATGYALASLARRLKLPAIFLVRSEAAREALSRSGIEHIIVTKEGFTDKLGVLSAELETTAVFDGVGGDLLTRIAPSLPMNSTISIYGLLGGSTPFSMQSALLMMRNLTMQRFSNFESKTVKDQKKRLSALKALEKIIDDPMFTTKIGQEFGYDQITQAMAYESTEGAKALLIA